MGGAQAPAKDEKHRGVLGDREGSAARLARGGKDAPAHGVAREHDGVLATDAPLEGGARLGQRHADVARMRRERLVGKAGDRVLLVEHVGDVPLAAAVHERQLDVGAKPHGDVWGSLLGKDLPHPRGGLALAHEGRDERPGPRAVEAGHVDGLELEARLRDERPLELGALAKEAHVVATSGELLGQSERRVDVARGAASGDRNL